MLAFGISGWEDPTHKQTRKAHPDPDGPDDSNGSRDRLVGT